MVALHLIVRFDFNWKSCCNQVFSELSAVSAKKLDSRKVDQIWTFCTALLVRNFFCSWTQNDKNACFFRNGTHSVLRVGKVFAAYDKIRKLQTHCRKTNSAKKSNAKDFLNRNVISGFSRKWRLYAVFGLYEQNFFCRSLSRCYFLSTGLLTFWSSLTGNPLDQISKTSVQSIFPHLVNTLSSICTKNVLYGCVFVVWH